MKKFILFSLLGTLLVSCSSKEKLKGERTAIILSEGADSVALSTDDIPVELDTVGKDMSCVQPFYNATHMYAPQKFSCDFKELWSSNLDFESEPTIKMATSPVVTNGKLFCMDAGGIVYAIDVKTGKRIWRKSTTIKGKDGQVGGALAYADGLIIVSTSFAECVAFNADNGQMAWRIKLSAPAKGDAITVYDGKAYIVCANSTLVVIDTKTGQTLWSHSGIQAESKFLGNAGVAIDSGTVYVTYSSGEIFALQIENGSVLWDSMVSKFSLTNTAETYPHPRACPVIKDGVLYVVAANGQTIAINSSSGETMWTADCGSVQTPIVSGNSIFIINYNSELICLNRMTGKKKWNTLLDNSDHISNWYGLNLCGENICVLSPYGRMTIVSAKDGTTKKHVNIVNSNDAISLNPVIANEIMYIQINSGKVVSYK